MILKSRKEELIKVILESINLVKKAPEINVDLLNSL